VYGKPDFPEVSMTTNKVHLALSAAHVWSAGASAAVELGARVLRVSAADAAELAQNASEALRAPEAQRAAAMEAARVSACAAQRRQLYALRGAGPFWSMAVLNRLAAVQTTPTGQR